jgi:predicted transcriptional regulator
MQNIDCIKKCLFVSIKPEFISKFLTSKKKIELRKMRPNVNIGDYLIMYVTSPIKSVIAFGTIKKLIDTSPQNMWLQYSSLLGIDKSKFDDYYMGKERAIGLEIENIVQITPIHLYDIRDEIPGFQPPQIFRYVHNVTIFKNLIEETLYTNSNKRMVLRNDPRP